MYKSLIAITLLAASAALAWGQELSWQKITSPDSSFSFEMPGDVKLDSALNMAGSQLITTYFYVSLLPVGSFVVSYTDFAHLKGLEMKESELQTLLEGELPKVVSNLQDVEVIYNEKDSLDGNRGRKIQVTGTSSGTPLVYTSRNYLVGMRLYEIMTQSVIGAVPGEYFKRFFESFTLLK